MLQTSNKTLWIFLLAFASMHCSKKETDGGGATATTPAAPNSLRAQAGDGEVTLTWDAVANATSYTLYWSSSAGVTVAGGTAIADLASPHAHTGLTNGATYYYVVVASNSSGASALSTEASATPLPPTPAASSDLSAEAGLYANTLSWSGVPGADSYTLYWSTAAGVTSSSGTAIDNVTSPYQHTGLLGETTYYYVVVAHNMAGDGAPSNEASAMPNAALPAAPSNLRANPNTMSVRLSWESVVGADSYTLYWATSPGVTPASGTAITNVTSPYRHDGLDAGLTYFYVLTASNALGEGAATAEVSARPLPTIFYGEVEPNDMLDPTMVDLETLYDVSLATPLWVSQVINGSVSRATGPDIDWYVVAPSGDGELTITLTPDAAVAGTDLDLQVIEATSYFPVGFAYGRSTGGDESVTLSVFAGQRYHVLVHDFQWMNVDVPYAISTLFSAASNDSADNNDTPAWASPIDAPAPAQQVAITATISAAADVDHYRLANTDADLAYAITLTPPTDRAYGLYSYLYEPTGTRMWTVQDGPVDSPDPGAESAVGFAQPAGDCYFSVQGAVKLGASPLGTVEERFFGAGAAYALVIASSPASPSNVAATSPSDGEYVLSWDASLGADSYSVYCSTTSPIDRGNHLYAEGVTGTTLAIRRLAGGDYYCSVSAVNGIGESGGSLEAMAIVTPLVAIYREDFNAGALPAGWSTTDLSGGSGNRSWSVGSNILGSAFDGSPYLYADTYQTAEVMDERVHSATITLPATATWLGFESLVESNLDTVEVYISNDAGVSYARLPWAPRNYGPWESVSLDISSYAGQAIQLAFRYAGDYGFFWHIDNVAIY